MNFRKLFFLGFAWGLIAAANSFATPPSPTQKADSQKDVIDRDSLDQKSIHAIYTGGDFEGVISKVDSFTAVHPTFSYSDSVFIAKHLAVIYSANPYTREKGKHYMFRLLNLMPSAKIVDMFVSDEIDHIFEKVREEYVVRQLNLGRTVPSDFESHRYAANRLSVGPNPVPSPEPEKRNREKPKIGNDNRASRALYWIAGGATFAAAAGATYFFLSPQNSPDKVYDLPE